MTWQNEAVCLISGERAEEALPREGDFQEIISPTYGRYRVANSVIPELAELDQMERIRILSHARAAAKGGDIPIITSASL